MLSKVGKQDACFQPAGKLGRVWDIIGQPVVEMDKDTGKSRLSQEKQGLVPLAIAGLSATKA